LTGGIRLRVTATHIENWAETRDAQAQLPLLVRRLVQATARTTELVMPSGDSISEPGWDGVSCATAAGAWVPPGPARWEMGCDARPLVKANEDFAKRVFTSDVEEMSSAVFVFVTPRRWRQRHTWRELAAQTAPWRGVRVIDADDLEAWLESAPAVTLWFGELLGLAGSGIESVARFWETWRAQSTLSLSAAALLADRDLAANRFDELIAQRAALVAIRADSQDEAVAFACIRLLATGLSGDAACVTTADGWRFVDSNYALRVGVACSAGVAATRAPRDGFTLVVPLSKGDRGESLLGSAAKAADSASSVVDLDRPNIATFEGELRKLGEEESDAVRLARTAGRSWSVYRRVCAKNPAIRRPAWLNPNTARTLSTLTLVGSWNDSKAGDRTCLEAISRRPYDELEAELLGLLGVDDSPVVRIGSVWRAKSALELIHLCAPQITTEALTRFLEVAEAVLAKPDPALELDEDKRWMAAVYGKVREESGIVIDAMVDSLVKLSVYAERRPAENVDAITEGVGALVRRLLQGGSGERWLSLSGVLRELGEAAPDEFLSAVESSLHSPDAPIRRLITETGDSGSFGRCWHAGLLWALEVLAWSPARLHRVAFALAQLCATPVPGNWGNTPAKSLASLFRPWWPQTMATSERRLAVLDRLIRDRNEAAWFLLVGMLPNGPQWASANAAPMWRDDDAGKASLRGTVDLWYLSEIGARAITQAEGHATRITALVDSLDSFVGTYQDSVIRLIEGATSFEDDGRNVVRESLCKYLGWHNSHNVDGDRNSRATVERLRPCFDALAPRDVVKRSLWLFASSWITLPDGRERDREEYQIRLERERSHAFSAVLTELGWPGVTRLANESGTPGLVGWEIGHAELELDRIVDWAIDRRESSSSGSVDVVLRGLLAGLIDDRRSTFTDLMTAKLLSDGSESGVSELLANAPFVVGTWRLVERFSETIQRSYWASVVPGFSQIDHADSAFAVDRLTKAGRPRTAYQLIAYDPEVVEPMVLKELLEAIRSGIEPDGPLPDGWHIGQAIRAIEATGSVPRRDLAMLEFAFFRVLEHTEHGTKNLYAELLSDPGLFMECICLIYKPRHREAEHVDESLKTAAELAWRVFHEGRGIPGAQGDGSIDETAFSNWIQEVRRLAAESDRSAVTDITIGSWLSECKPAADGARPPIPLGSLLDRDDLENVRRGFFSGLLNNRGMTTRTHGEGGAQEKALAFQFRKRAAAIADCFPRLAELLNSIAKHYEVDARREDDEANLQRESP
jgi:hypothetical protein